MGELFGALLKRHRESRGVTGYRICQISGMPNSLFVGIEKGNRPPSDANLESLAGVPELGVSLEQLRAWRTADRVGVDDLWFMLTEAKEVVHELVRRRGDPRFVYTMGIKMTKEAIAAEAAQGALTAAAAAGDIARAQEHLTGPGIRPLTDREWRYVDELLAITGGDLGQVSLYKGAPVWYLDEDERLAALRQQVKELKPQAKRKKGAG